MYIATPEVDRALGQDSPGRFIDIGNFVFEYVPRYLVCSKLFRVVPDEKPDNLGYTQSNHSETTTTST